MRRVGLSVMVSGLGMTAPHQVISVDQAAILLDFRGNTKRWRRTLRFAMRRADRSHSFAARVGLPNRADAFVTALAQRADWSAAGLSLLGILARTPGALRARGTTPAR